MSIEFLAGMLVFFVTLLLGRHILTRALASLDADKKSDLLVIYTRHRNINLIVMVVLFLVFFSLQFVFPGQLDLILIIYICLLILFIIGAGVFRYLKLQRVGMPPAFVRSDLLALCIQNAGAVVLLILVMLQFNK